MGLCGEHACVVHVSMFMYVHTESRGGHLVPLCHSLAYSVETGSLGEVGTLLVAPVTLLSLPHLPQGKSSQPVGCEPLGVSHSRYPANVSGIYITTHKSSNIRVMKW